MRFIQPHQIAKYVKHVQYTGIRLHTMYSTISQKMQIYTMPRETYAPPPPSSRVLHIASDFPEVQGGAHL